MPSGDSSCTSVSATVADRGPVLAQVDHGVDSALVAFEHGLNRRRHRDWPPIRPRVGVGPRADRCRGRRHPEPGHATTTRRLIMTHSARTQPSDATARHVRVVCA